MTTQQPGFLQVDPVASQIPGYVLQQLQAQRTQAIAQALSQQSLAPLDYDNRGHVSWTQGLAKALQGVVSTKLADKSMEQQALLAQQASQARAQAYGFGQQQPYAPSPASTALAQGAAAGNVGPTMYNAARMNALPPPAPAAPAGQLGTPLNPYGAPPLVAMMAAQGDPAAQEMLKTFLANKQLTPEQRNAMDPTIGPAVQGNLVTQNMTPAQKLAYALKNMSADDPQRAGVQGALTKENYITPIDAKPGTPILDPITMQPRFFAPKTADGVGLSFNDPLHPQAYPLPGYAGAVSGIEGAVQGAKTANSIGEATTPSGAPVKGYNRDLFNVPSSTQDGRDSEMLPILRAERAKPTNSPADNAALDREIAKVTGGRTITGPSATDAVVQKSSADAIATAPQMVQQSKAAVTGLESALRVLQNVRATGPSTMGQTEWNAVLNNFGLTPGKTNTENYQILAKYLQNSLNAAAQGTGASGSDARFESFMHGQPNVETMNKGALEGAIRYVLSQHDAAGIKGQFLTDAYQKAQASGDPNAALTAQQQWSKAYKPDYFAFNRMAPDEQRNFLKQEGAMAADFVKGYNAYSAQYGWVH